MRKKADCRMVLVRLPRPISCAIFVAFLRSVGSKRQSRADGIDGDVVLSEVALHLVGHELLQLGIVEDGVQQERAVLLQATGHIVHVQVSLNVASHEVRRGHEVGRADGRVTETQVRAGEAARLLGVVREVSLAILVGVVTDNLH